MNTVWYLVIVLNIGSPAQENSASYSIEYKNQALCIRNRNAELQKPEVANAFCKKTNIPVFQGGFI